MRASDLVRGKISKPVSITNGLEGLENKPLPGNIPGQSNFNTKTPPPVISPEQPPEQRMLLDDTLFTARGKNIYNDAVSYLQDVRERLPRSGIPLSLERPLRMIEQMIEEPSLIDEMYQFTLTFGRGDDFEISSPVNNMIYCFKIGVRMGYTQSDRNLSGGPASRHRHVPDSQGHHQ